MPRLRLLHCGLLLAGCTSALLCAGTSPGLSLTIEGAFIARVQTWDLNHDGYVTCEEWRTYAVSLFEKADSDHDGKLTREEFAKLPKIDRLFEVANFDYYDVNRQGYVTQADFVDRPNPAFAALDHDKSCVINSDQLGLIRDQMRAYEEAGAKKEQKTKEKECASCMEDMRLNCKNTYATCQEHQYNLCARICRD
jgi:Ca2+-binding EF-hand superfamily protein